MGLAVELAGSPVTNPLPAFWPAPQEDVAYEVCKRARNAPSDKMDLSFER
jgi:hypothetical protein